MLKQLLLRKKIESLREKIGDIEKREKELKDEEKELTEEIEHSDEEITDEAREVLEDKAEEYSSKKESLLTQKEDLEKELEEVEKELEELDDKDDKVEEKNEINKDDESEKRNHINNKELELRGGLDMEFEKREKIAKLVKKQENRDFFDNIKNLVMRADTTQLTGKELLIPTEVISAINSEIYNYGSVVNLVHRIPIKGGTRIVFNAGTPKLFWTEKCASLEEAVLGELKELELDNFKLGGYVFLCKAFVEDAIIDIADYVINEFAKAIAIALDEAIIKGEGATQKQPEGITTVVEEVSDITNLLDVLGLVGTLNNKAKQISLVTNRKTYYSNILPETYGKDSSGKIVYGLGQTLPDGTKIVISDAVEDGEIIIGDFYQGYKLGERKSMTFDSSDQVRWIEEQIGYKTSGRYDGKVADATLFARGKFVEPEEDPAA